MTLDPDFRQDDGVDEKHRAIVPAPFTPHRALSILPRQGEVAGTSPDGGGGMDNHSCVSSPSVTYSASLTRGESTRVIDKPRNPAKASA